MKRLVVLLLLLTPWVMYTMEPEEFPKEELKLETMAKRYLEGKGGELPVLPVLPSQIIAQELLSKGPIKPFILSHVSLPVKNCVGHTDKVDLVQFISNGDKIVTGSDDGTARIWNTATGEPLYTLASTDKINSVAFNQANDTVVTGSQDTTIKKWNSATGNLIQSYTGGYDFQGAPAPVFSVTFSPAGDTVVGGSTGPITLWDTATEARSRFIFIQGHTGPVFSVGFNPAGDTVVTGSEDTTARLWDTATGTLRYALEGHAGPVRSAVFNPGGDTVVTGSEDTTARLWDTATGKLLYTLQGHTEPVWSAVFNPGGDKVITASDDTTAGLWDTATGKLLYTLQGHTEPVWSAVFNPTGDKALTGSYDGTAKIWDAKTGKLLHTLKGHTKAVESAVFNPTGNKVATVSWDGTAKIWDLEPLLKTQEFLEKEITFKQAVILNAIFEVIKTRGSVKALGVEAFEKGALILSPEAITFDFNKYPNLWDDYNALPEAMRGIFDPYVAKLSSSAQEQASIGS